MKLPPNIIQLHPEDTVLVEKAAACLRRAFLGTTQVPGAPIMKEAYYGVKHNDQPLDEISLNDIGLRRFNNWSMNFTLYRNLPFGGVFVYVEDDAANNNNNANHNCTVVSSVAVCIPPNNYEWDTYEIYDPSVLGLVLCPWNCSAVGIPPFSVLLDCCYESASRLKMLEKCDLEMRHRVMLNKKYLHGTAFGANSCTATEVANSDKAATGAITGNTFDTVSVTCDSGYAGSCPKCKNKDQGQHFNFRFLSTPVADVVPNNGKEGGILVILYVPDGSPFTISQIRLMAIDPKQVNIPSGYL